MTITLAISRVDELRPNTISDEQKAAWVMELDGQLAERLDAKPRVSDWPS